MEYHSALKREEILTHATTWVNLEDITLNKINLSQKDKCCVIPLIRHSQNSQTLRIKEWNSDCQGLEGKRNGKLLINQHKA